MQLSQLTDQALSTPDDNEEEEEDGVSSTDSELVEAYYEGMSLLGESLDFLESALQMLPKGRKIIGDIKKHTNDVREFLSEQGFVDED